MLKLLLNLTKTLCCRKFNLTNQREKATMNIKKASNYEINKAVAETFGYVVKAQIGKNDFVFIDQPDFDLQIEFDYCNQWEDAGPIIQDNEIGIRPPDILSPGWMASNSANGKNNSDIFVSNKNPLRAAMEVYLMIKAADRERRQEST